MLIALQGKGSKRDYRDVARTLILFDAPGHLESIHPGQLDIGKDEQRMVAAQQFQSLFGTGGGQDLIPFVHQQNPRQFEVYRRVVDD